MSKIKFSVLDNSSFTLMELMVAALILALVLVGLLASYVTCVELADMGRNSSRAIQAAQAKAEEIKAANYADLYNLFDAEAFIPFDLVQTAIGVQSSGTTYAFPEIGDPKTIIVTVCWRQQNGRIIGEDLNLNGNLDGGVGGPEDPNGNGMIDSPVQIVTIRTNLNP